MLRPPPATVLTTSKTLTMHRMQPGAVPAGHTTEPTLADLLQATAMAQYRTDIRFTLPTGRAPSRPDLSRCQYGLRGCPSALLDDVRETPSCTAYRARHRHLPTGSTTLPAVQPT